MCGECSTSPVTRGSNPHPFMPDLEIDVVFQPGHPRRQHRADDAERYDEQHREGNRPALVQGREAEEDEEGRDRV